MFKTVSALKARQNLGQIMNEVALREDVYVVERSGKPLVAIIPIEKYQQILKEKEEFFSWVTEMRDRTKDVESSDIETAVKEAVKAVRQ